MSAISTIIVHRKGKARGQFPGVFRDLRARAGPAGCPGTCGGSRRTIVRTGSEEAALRGGGGESGRLRAWRLFPASPEEGIESLGHDGRGARPAVSTGGLIAGPPLYVHHDRSLRGKSEDLTIPVPSFPLLSKIQELRNGFVSCRVNVYTSPLPPNTNAKPLKTWQGHSLLVGRLVPGKRGLIIQKHHAVWPTRTPWNHIPVFWVGYRTMQPSDGERATAYGL